MTNNTKLLKHAFDTIVKAINVIKGEVPNHRLFKHLCTVTGAEHGLLLFHLYVIFLSTGHVFDRVFELRKEVLSS